MIVHNKKNIKGSQYFRKCYEQVINVCWVTFKSLLPIISYKKVQSFSKEFEEVLLIFFVIIWSFCSNIFYLLRSNILNEFKICVWFSGINYRRKLFQIQTYVNKTPVSNCVYFFLNKRVLWFYIPYMYCKIEIEKKSSSFINISFCKNIRLGILKDQKGEKYENENYDKCP